jgi:hypothetical protein
MLALAVVGTIAYLLNRATALDVRLALAESRRLEARYVAEAGVEHALWRANQAGCSGYSDLPTTAFGNHTYAARVAPTSGPRVGITAVGTLDDGTRQTYRHAALPVVETISSTLQPGAGTEDATIDAKEPIKNYGGDPSIVVSNFGIETSHALLRFDLSAIPADALAVSAQLRVYLESIAGAPAGAEVSARRVTRDWVEGTLQGAEPADGATWLTHDGTNAWVTAGADVDSSAVASVLVGAVGQYHELDVSGFVRDWHNGVSPNYGVRLEGTPGLRTAQFLSGDDSDVSKQPQLAIAYTRPCPPPIPPNSEVFQSVADTYITGPGSGSPQGTKNYARIGVKSDGESQYALLRFDVLSVIPANATVSSARVRVYEYKQTGSVTFPVTAHKITQSWSGLLANWTDATFLTPWTAGPGGTYDATVLDTTTVNTGDGWREWNVTPLVQEWVDGVSPDYGVQLINGPVAPDNYIEFYTLNSSQPNKPQLVVIYAP